MTRLRGICLFVLLCVATNLEASSGTSGTTNTIPRSRNSGSSHYSSHHDDGEECRSSSVHVPRHYPPWNPSKHIDDDGFLTTLYPLCVGEWEEEVRLRGRHSGRSSRRTLHTRRVRVRQVPGDGNCLFHSLSTCLIRAERRAHVDMRDDAETLYRTSRWLRSAAVDCLASRPRRVLFLQGEERLRAADLVEAAAGQYNMTGEDYCEVMRRESYWGGGPEIVALCNVLRRPIHVYELAEDGPEYYEQEVEEENTVEKKAEEETPKQRRKYQQQEHKRRSGFRLRRMACFGSPRFDNKEPLHILSADSRFPDVLPGRQLASGNHFLALFPVNEEEEKDGVMATERLRDVQANVRGGRSETPRWITVFQRRSWLRTVTPENKPTAVDGK